MSFFPSFYLPRLLLIALLLAPLPAFAKGTATPAASTIKAAFAALDRGRASEALALADRAPDQVLADAVRGEAYAARATNNLTEMYTFLARHPDWPQRNGILAAAEGYLPGESCPPATIANLMRQVYSIDNQPVTSLGFDAWIAALRDANRNDEAKMAIRLRWQRAKLVSGQEDDFRAKYGSVLTAKDDAIRQLALDGGPSARWKDTAVQIRDLLSQKDYREGYNLSSRHGLDAGANTSDYANAEFMAGWLALRFMNDPARAERHFENLYTNVKTPVSKSRGAYWLGRAYEAQGNTGEARKWYEEGATYQTFFYGQLSRAKLMPNAPLALPPEPAVPAKAAAAWNARALPHIVRSLISMGETDRATRFLKALMAASQTRADFVMADQLARDLGDPYLEVQVSKAANQKNFILNQCGFPVTALAQSGNRPEPALALGIIRQESEFRADAQSNAGAMGLMQLMPSTARALAKELDMPRFRDSDLLTPHINVPLGKQYIADRVDEFNGSYILAIASYNAGKGRVREWLGVYGDPRDPKMDPVDWIELIPNYETRNYVQRVLENVQVYRARLYKNPPLGIVKDLTR